MTPDERFWSKVQPAPALDCWLWTASVKGTGYGQVYWEGRPQHAHRIAYRLMVGDIPEGLHLDHLCRVRTCVNPWHLDPVPNAVNAARNAGHLTPKLKTHCKYGHEFTPENTYNHPGGYRCCKTCERRRSLDAYYRRKARAMQCECCAMRPATSWVDFRDGSDPFAMCGECATLGAERGCAVSEIARGEVGA